MYLGIAIVGLMISIYLKNLDQKTGLRLYKIFNKNDNENKNGLT